MRDFLVTLVINMLSIAIAVTLVPGLYIEDNSLLALAVVALVFGLVNAILRPVFMLLSLPFIVLTLGLFVFILNGILLVITSYVSPLVITGFGWAVLGAVIISLLNILISGILVEDNTARA